MCLNTFGELFHDTLINVSLIEGTAEADGEEFLCDLWKVPYVNAYIKLYMSVR